MHPRPDHLLLLISAVILATAGYLLWVRYRDRSGNGGDR